MATTVLWDSSCLGVCEQSLEYGPSRCTLLAATHLPKQMCSCIGELCTTTTATMADLRREAHANIEPPPQDVFKLKVC